MKSCVGECSSFRECVLCKVFDTGYFNDELCSLCSVGIEIVDVIDGKKYCALSYSQILKMFSPVISI